MGFEEVHNKIAVDCNPPAGPALPFVHTIAQVITQHRWVITLHLDKIRTTDDSSITTVLKAF